MCSWKYSSTSTRNAVLRKTVYDWCCMLVGNKDLLKLATKARRLQSNSEHQDLFMADTFKSNLNKNMSSLCMENDVQSHIISLWLKYAIRGQNVYYISSFDASCHGPLSQKENIGKNSIFLWLSLAHGVTASKREVLNHLLFSQTHSILASKLMHVTEKLSIEHASENQTPHLQLQCEVSSTLRMWDMADNTDDTTKDPDILQHLSEVHLQNQMAREDPKWRSVGVIGTGTSGQADTAEVVGLDRTHPQEASIQHHTPSPDLEPTGEEEERLAPQQVEARHWSRAETAGDQLVWNDKQPRTECDGRGSLMAYAPLGGMGISM